MPQIFDTFTNIFRTPLQHCKLSETITVVNLFLQNLLEIKNLYIEYASASELYNQ